MADSDLLRFLQMLAPPKIGDVPVTAVDGSKPTPYPITSTDVAIPRGDYSATPTYVPEGYKPDPRTAAFIAALGNKPVGGEQVMGASNLPGEIQAPRLDAADYTASDAALQASRPHPISAPQYVKPNYAASDQLWEQAAPHPLDASAMEDDKWGRILTGTANGILNADHQKFLAGVIGGLGGYGNALQNRTKMTADQAEKTSEYLARKAGYTERKIGDQAQSENAQLTANYQADRSNQTENSTFYRALGNQEESKATNRAGVQNKNAELGYQADVRNKEIQAQKRGLKVLGQKGNDILYQYIDKDNNVVVGTKPIASFHGANGNVQGKMAGGDGSVSGLETLIEMSKNTGALRAVLGDATYAQLIKPETDYGSGTMGDLAAHYGDAGKKAALERAMADENNLIAQYLTNNPDKLDALVGALAGSK